MNLQKLYDFKLTYSKAFLVFMFLFFAKLTDLVLSYIAFCKDPIYFYIHEANRYIADCFITKAFPIEFFQGMIVYFFCFIIFVFICKKLQKYIYQLNKNSIKDAFSYTQFLYAMSFIFMGLGHIFAGSTWYTDSELPNIISQVFTYTSSLILYVIIISVAVIGIYTIRYHLKLYLKSKRENNDGHNKLETDLEQ